ncbi:TPR domain protein, putative component of TonB system [Marinobacter nitratireducens]|uniref:TPR domain protein, putative component of TonB system n=2 Tax=Marinobacter nitratireducens TaxID=1137280 RepID=A0A072N327_9GAMM|nr:TPR domain protein, putative component of TonB system [Marinobacter nitratireducens]
MMALNSLSLVAVSASAKAASAAPGQVHPERPLDLRYGEVLYNYYQGQSFEALTLLSVAEQQGGVRNHGDYPELVKGGLLLTYGMTREAEKLFTDLLGEDGDGRLLPPEVRNHAWFYLGKVFFLRGKTDEAFANLARVDGANLKQTDPALFSEWQYLRARLAMSAPRLGGHEEAVRIRARMNPTTLWQAYLDYNLSVSLIEDRQWSKAIPALESLCARLADFSETPDGIGTEQEGLLGQARLTLARAYLNEERLDQSLKILDAMPEDGMFFDRALFDYAVAASGQGDMEKAFQALDRLTDIRNPGATWAQPVPYARGQVLENLGRPVEALSAFRAAAEQYELEQVRLKESRAGFSESALMSKLDVESDGAGYVTDAYGHLTVLPRDSGFSDLLATEPFQQALSELQEFYRLQALLATWQRQLGSFDTMLETREIQREERIQETRAAMIEQRAEEWLTLHQRYREQIDHALDNEDYAFFLSNEQKQLKSSLEQIAATLEHLPIDERTRAQRQQYRRMKAYFDWSIVNDYGINRWEVQKQQGQLDRAMEVFNERRVKLDELVVGDGQLGDLSRRVEQKKDELTAIRLELDEAVADARERLMSRVDSALAERQAELQDYLRASRHAQARLADRLYEEDKSDASLDLVVMSYASLLPLVNDPRKRIQIRHRLADLEFTRAERVLAETAVDELSTVIGSYQRLLKEYPNRSANDRIHYQMARAWELRGEVNKQLQSLDALVERYPDSDYWIEAQFRRGDLLFSNGQYAAAQQAFDDVVIASQAQGADESFLVNAHYMKGWSQFKQTRYQQALYSYLEVLDLVLPEGKTPQGADQIQQTLIEDLFRVVGLSLSYLDGAKTLQDLFATTGSRPYETLIYDRYSKLLVEREQYSDAIDVYAAYIETHPESPWAPRYHIKMIQTLELAGFTSTIEQLKADFILDYGLGGSYRLSADVKTLEYVDQQLERLLPELADQHYLMASTSDSDSARSSHYRQAANYYAEFASTFPNHPRAPERLFLLGESYLALEEWAPAIEAFERVAYDFSYDGAGAARAAEAGYASVLAYRDYARTWNAKPQGQLESHREFQQLNRLRFANAFPSDSRAPGVFYAALQYEYENGEWEETVSMTARLLTWRPQAPSSLITEAVLLSGHSLSELGRHEEAEQAYRDALALMGESDARRKDTRENLAASIYRQAEALADDEQIDPAVTQYLRIGKVVPESALRANAEYDAASLLIGAGLWERAIGVLNGYRSAFPEHPLANTVPAKLALAYRETEQWSKAGDELNRMVDLANTPEEQRENLLIAAELYDRAGDTGKAITAWRRYANTYPEPGDQYMESADRLASLYHASGDLERRNYWLNRQMAYVDSHPSSSDDRMRWLAASASALLAREALQRYDRIRLTLPLTKSMVAKTDALESAVKAFQRTAGYGVSAYSTEAGYQIARIYGRLGADLMDSERPEGLTQLELEQYEILLEEQAYPFEDNAIDIHEQNIRHARDGIYDQWVKRSYESLQRLLPGRYNKTEVSVGVVNDLD